MTPLNSYQVFRDKDQREIKGARVISLVLCLVLFGVCAKAQPASQNGKSGEAEDGKPEVKLSTHTPRICLNSTLPLVLEITNPGQQEIKINKSDLWTRFNYTSPGSKFSGSSIACGFWDDNPQSWVTVSPSAKYLDTHLYFTEGSYFKAAGIYRISTSLPYYVGDKSAGYITTNEVEFEIYDCAAE